MTTESSIPATVNQMMTSDVVSLRAGSTVHDALTLMVENRVSALPVVDRDDRCVGIVSTTDLTQVTYDIDDDFVHSGPLDPSGSRRFVEKLGSAIGSEPIASFMSEEVCSIDDGATIPAAARVMLKNQVHHLPVVNAEERLVGILSTMDVLAAIVDES